MNLNLVGSVANAPKKARDNVASAGVGPQVASRATDFTSGTHYRFVLLDTLFEMPPRWTISFATPFAIASWVNFKTIFGRLPCFVGRNLGAVENTGPKIQ